MRRDFSKLLLAGLCMLAFSNPVLAGKFIVLHKFKGGSHDGMDPHSSLTPDGLGNLYGTTAWGGHKACDPYGCGTIYRIAPDGTLTTIYEFTGGSDGFGPAGGLTLAPDGSLYGATTRTVYRLTANGQVTVIYTFTGGEDGQEPAGNLVLDNKGNLYGITIFGGFYGLGTLFEITPQGQEIHLHDFAETETDGGEPAGGVIFDAAGSLYGTAAQGGSHFAGTIFRLTPQGDYSTAYNFPGGSGSQQPMSDLWIDKDGNFYGTSLEGGDYGYGTVFKWAPSAAETVLHSFSGSDGANPQGGVVIDKRGNLYGTTTRGGSSGPGIIFKLASDGTETVLHTFTGKDGYASSSTLTTDGLGYLYGVSEGGGSTGKHCYSFGCGTVFRVNEK